MTRLYGFVEGMIAGLLVVLLVVGPALITGKL